MEIKPVVFFVGEEQYGVDINIVRGIERTVPIVPIPNCNPIIKGIINLRGDIIPICSLRRKFGLPNKAYDENTKFIVVKTDSLLIAIEVDSVGDIQNVDEKDVHSLPTIVRSKDTDYYKNVINKNGKLLVMLDIGKIMSEEEMRALGKTIEDMSN